MRELSTENCGGPRLAQADRPPLASFSPHASQRLHYRQHIYKAGMKSPNVALKNLRDKLEVPTQGTVCPLWRLCCGMHVGQKSLLPLALDVTEYLIA